MKKTNGFLWADIAGLSLTTEDKEVLAHPGISGLILFSRNYESLDQLRELTCDIAKVSPELVITVDQEGGRVQRFREGFTELPAMGSWGSRYMATPEKAKHDFALVLHTMISELHNAGIYSSLVPVLDIDYNRNAVIGHRSFGQNKNIVIELSHFMIDQCHQLKMPVTGKHFPGHGFVTVDSHFDLPIDERSLSDISERDLQPFLRLAPRLDAIMLAHIVYSQVDPLPVCFSRYWIEEVLRHQLQFDGLVMCDDLSMQAVATMGSYEDRATMALEAGCDILLACNDRAGVIEILDHVSPQKNEGLSRRMQHYSRFLR